MGRRRKARELLVQSLYASRVGGQDLTDAVQQQIARRSPGPDSLAYVNDVVPALQAGAAEFDTQIDAVLTGRSPQRVGVVERCILHLALAELKTGSGVPETVVLNEAMELARTFGTEDSARFVNGVLDRVLHRMRDDAGASS